MSNFKCEHCKTEIIDSLNGYKTGCEHHPIEELNKKLLTTDEVLLMHERFMTVMKRLSCAEK